MGSEQVVEVSKQADTAAGVNEQYIFVLFELPLVYEVNHTGQAFAAVDSIE